MKTWVKVYLSEQAKRQLEEAAQDRHLSVSALAAYVIGEWLANEKKKKEEE